MAYSRDQWIALGVMYSAIMIVAASVWLTIPFYPVHERGVTPFQFAWFAGGYFLVKSVVCQAVGRYIHRYGIRFTLSAGSFLVGGSMVIFGMLAYIQKFSAFLAESYASIYLTAVGAALVVTSSTTLVTKGYPDDIGAVFAGIQISSGVGQILGPLAGGALYKWMGFTTTFTVFGSLLLVHSVIAACTLPTHTNELKEENLDESIGQTLIFRYYRTLKFLVPLFGAVFTKGLFMVSMPFFLDPMFIIKLLMIQSVAHSVSSWLSGWACDRWLCPTAASVVGSAVTMVSVLLEGADPVLLVHNQVVQQVLANILLGIGAGTQIVASFSGLSNECLEMGLPDTLSTKGIVSGGWNTIFCFGYFLGNSVCGGLLKMIGDYWTSLAVFILGFVVFTLTSIDLIKQRIRKPKIAYRKIP